MAKPYFADEHTTLYHGDMREIVPQLGLQVDLIVADPPYGETALQWDQWTVGWPSLVKDAARSLWCFGSLRMFLANQHDFADWKLSHEVIWEKPVGSSMAADRFKRVHEYALHWYRGRWDEIHHEPPREAYLGPDRGSRHGGADRGEHFGTIRSRTYTDNGTRLMRSVLRVTNMHGKAIHPTEKPIALLDPLIRYACPPGGTVLDPFAGSGSTAAAARLSGRRCVLIEADERYCQQIARRLQQGILDVVPGGAA